MYDKDGKKYLDVIAGISVSNLGHRHPAVTKAIHEQTDKYMHLMVYGEYIYHPQVQLSTLLSAQLAEHLNAVYLVNSGTEATEGAMKLAKRYTGRTEVIGFKDSYHGSTQGSLSIIGDEYFKENYRPLIPDTRSIRYNNEEDLALITERTACVFTEVVQAESGVTPAHPCWLRKLRERCTKVGALLIFDEIQTGYGRTGTLFAHQQYNVEPDIILLAKGMGGGLPIGAFVANNEVMAVFQDNPVLGHITTFGGNPVCSAAALAVLETLLKEDYITQVKAKETLFRSLLVHPKIKFVRSFGLIMAVGLESFEFNLQVISKCIEKGLITDWFLFESSCLRIAPPLIITEEEIKFTCEVILTSLSELS
ncbi:UNVERIFIED_CONTAM: hypothetical protein GTU68_043702 [Idotea baltica]|nr:hypothetical protein [Idotea baltica]